MILTFESDRARSEVVQPAGGNAQEVDDVLVARAKADPRAFGPLYERYHDRIFRYCYTRLGSRDVAEDATAEVFLKALANLRKYRQGTVFIAWLYTIARHAVADLYRKQRPAEPWDETVAERSTGGAGQGLHEIRSGSMAYHLDRAALAQALAQLPADQQAVLELGLAGWTGAETAAALGKSLGAVKMLRYRAMERLQQLLAVER